MDLVDAEAGDSGQGMEVGGGKDVEEIQGLCVEVLGGG